MYIFDWLVDILRRIFDIVKRMYQNDKEATIMGVVLYFVGVSLLSIQKNTQWGLFGRDGSHEFFSFLFWVLMAAYVGGLYHLMKTGQKLNLFKSFKRAKDAVMVGPKAQSPEKKETEPIKPKATDDDKRVAEVKPVPQINPDKPQHQNTPPSHPGTVYKPDAKLETAVKKGISFVGEFLSSEEKQAGNVLNISAVEEAVKGKIKGQDHAVDIVISTLKRVAAGIRTKQESPLSVFLFVGPTGTGKTEIVKQIASATGRHMVRFDMPNYSTEGGIWELIGSPTGYVGSDKAGRLTGEIQANPTAVLLLDEIEKAHPKMWDPFLRVLDEGKLRDQSKGFTANFKNVLIFLTSNLMAFEDWTNDEKALRNKLLNEGYFRPELVNRIDRIVMFKQFTPEILSGIVRNMLVSFVQRFESSNKISADIKIDRNVIEFVIKNVDLKFGVRDAERFVEKYLGDAVAEAYLQAIGKPITEIAIAVKENKVEVAIR